MSSSDRWRATNEVKNDKSKDEERRKTHEKWAWHLGFISTWASVKIQKVVAEKVWNWADISQKLEFEACQKGKILMNTTDFAVVTAKGYTLWVKVNQN